MGIFEETQKGVFVYVHNEDKSINIQGNNTFEGSLINTGDGSEQTVNYNKSEPEWLISLKNEIEKIIDQNDKEDALENATKIKSAIDQEKPERARKIFGWLPQLIQTSAAGAQLLQVISTL